MIINLIDIYFQVDKHNVWDKTGQPRHNSCIIFNFSQTVYCWELRKESIMVHFFYKVFLSSVFNVIQLTVIFKISDPY